MLIIISWIFKFSVHLQMLAKCDRRLSRTAALGCRRARASAYLLSIGTVRAINLRQCVCMCVRVFYEVLKWVALPSDSYDRPTNATYLPTSTRTQLARVADLLLYFIEHCRSKYRGTTAPCPAPSVANEKVIFTGILCFMVKNDSHRRTYLM